MVRKALDTDFARMLKEDRVLKYLAKSDAAVASGEKTVNESLEEVRLLLSRPLAQQYLKVLSCPNISGYINQAALYFHGR